MSSAFDSTIETNGASHYYNIGIMVHLLDLVCYGPCLKEPY